MQSQMTQPAQISAQPRVTILMGVLNGTAHLNAQLDSIASQSHRNWRLVCSDDGSTDTSNTILARFAQEHPAQVDIKKGPKSGFAANYMQLIGGLPSNPGYVCFSDQDDIWLPDKIACAISGLPGDKPTLYCGRTLYWYPKTGRKVPSRSVQRPCHLRNALIENVATGNTIMLNPPAARVARAAAQQTGAVFAHDWWLYLLVNATGGHVHFDNGPPHVLYRQHDTNQIGAGRGLHAQLVRKAGVLQGAFADRIALNLAALAQVENLLTPDAARTIADFAAARQTGGLERLRALRAVRPYRQHWQGNLGYWGAACLARV